jgi:hypothetical protein
MRIVAVKGVLLGLIATCCCYSDDSATVRTVVWDSPQRDTNGQPLIHFETTFRGKERILVLMRKREGGVVRSSRLFVVSGNSVLLESDEDGSGKFETVVLFNEPKGGLEVFKRQPDGSVKPADDKTIAAFRRQFSAIAGFWEEMLGPKAPSDKFFDSAKALKKEIQDAEKQKDWK